MVNGNTGWRTLAEPTYATSRFGRTVQFPAGTRIRSLNPPTDEPFPDAIRVVATKGSPFECELTVLVLPDGTSKPPFEVPALWWVTASALRFEDGCGQCSHPRDAHRLYTKDGDDEPWSFCSECGGDCEFVGPRASLGERLGFQPIQSRTHGYNGQEHR